MPALRQSSFAGGELAPSMWGRDDLSKYRESVRGLRNCIITPTGAIQNRPGTQFVRAVKDSSKKVRLIPFVYSDSQSYILEFGNLYVRFHSYGGTVESSPGVPYEVVTPYLEAQLPLLKFAQVGDVMTLAHPSHSAYELKRNSHTSWTLAALNFDRPNMLAGSHAPAINNNPPGIPAPDATHPEMPWVWKVTKLYLENGIVRESAPWTVIFEFTGGPPGVRSNSTIRPRIPLYFPDFFVKVDWTSGGLTTGAFAGWRIYRGQGNRFGLVGVVSNDTTTDRFFIDYGFEPDYSQGPPQGKNPFRVYSDSSGSLIRTEEPSAVAFFEQRRVFARTDERPAWLFFSRTDDYANYDNYVPSVDDEAVLMELASRRREEIRWLANFAQRLVVGTNSSVWSVGGAGGAPLTPASIEAKVQSEVGASWLDPIITNSSLLYVRTKGVGVRDLAFSNERGAYAGNDLSALAQHLFQGHQVVSWAWQEDPYGIIWAVREDGTLLSCTYIPEAGKFGWGRHDTQGLFEQVCTVPESTLDAVYVVVKRTVGGATVRYIERFASRDIDEVEESIFVDATASAFYTVKAAGMSGLAHLEGQEVSVLADGQVFEGVTVSGGAVLVDLPDGALTLHTGLRYDSDIELLDVPEARTKAKTVKRAVLEIVATGGVQVGEDEDSLTDAKLRTVPEDYGVSQLRTQDVPVEIRNTWNRGHGRVFIRQREPLPLTLVGVTREVVLGGS